MNKRKLIIFLLCAFLPTIAAGMVMHLLGGSPSALSIEPLEGNKVQAIAVIALTTAAMLFPMIAVIITQRVTKEPVLKGLGISFKINRWWFIGWLLMPVIAVAVLGVTLLMPGAVWNPDNEIIRTALESMPEGVGLWGMLAITLFSGLYAGITLNALFAFGEEIAWRGYLLKLFEGKKFMTTALLTGTIWGLWHAPIILNGHNYPQHPVIGVLMMVMFCVLLTPMLMYFRKKSGSVIVPAIMHGTFNGVIGITLIMVTPANDLLYGGSGLAGFITILVIDIFIYIYDRFISRENILGSEI